jgi:hypothetical protein
MLRTVVKISSTTRPAHQDLYKVSALGSEFLPKSQSFSAPPFYLKTLPDKDAGRIVQLTATVASLRPESLRESLLTWTG